MTIRRASSVAEVGRARATLISALRGNRYLSKSVIGIVILPPEGDVPLPLVECLLLCSPEGDALELAESFAGARASLLCSQDLSF